MGYRNSEGFYDPTAGAAIDNVMREDEIRQERQRRHEEEIVSRPTVYIASKYAGDVTRNIKVAKLACRFAVKHGYRPLAAHLLYPRFMNDKDPEERLVGTMFGIAMLQGCDEVWVITEDDAHKEISEGMQREIDEAMNLGIPVRYFSTKEIIHG